MDKEYITVSEASRKLSISDRAVRQWIASGKLEAERNGRSWRILASSIESGSESEDDFRMVSQMQSEIDRLRNGLAETDRKLASADSEIAHLGELVEEKTDQIRHLREHLAEKDNQINHLQQIVAMSQKNIAALTEQLDSSRQMLEDMRHRSWWQRLFRR